MSVLRGFTVWFTGLSGSGKSTISAELDRQLRARGVPNIEIMDGDEVREHLSKGLTFSKEDRDINIKRIAFVCHLLTRNGVPNIAAAISPYRETRDYARNMIKNFVEVHVAAPLEVCEERDVKGLYQKARTGEIESFTGVSDPYEAPLNPEVVCHTHEESVEESAEKIIDYLVREGYLKAAN
ncbi:MAG: adenylyl-sulfate kinase [Candidatus Omnitrophica bacterium]|nr:adenylyl-sulfate kinase [Candidatus Omnitrophota bacterium]